MKNTEEKTKRKFKLFDMNRDGKGVYEQESRKPTVLFFFKLLKRKFPQLLQLNLLLLFMVIPLLVVIGIYFLGNKTPTVTDISYASLYGIDQVVSLPGAMLDMTSIQMDIPAFSPFMNVLIIVMVLFLAITFGWQQAGATYVLRGLFRGDAVFVFSDYFYAIKRNFKQAFFMGLFDFICCAVLIIDFFYFRSLTGTSFGFDFMFFTIFAISIIYIIMRFYTYTLMITFDLSTLKILKNSLIFTVLGIKRNILALLGIALLIIIHLLLIWFLLPVGITIPIILPFVYIMAILGFMAIYASYPIIDKHMIEPYKAQDSLEESE